MKDTSVYWDYDSNVINLFLDEFKEISGYKDFKFKYNWGFYPEIEDYIKRVMYTSFARSKEIRGQLPTLIHNIEDFFAFSIRDGFISKTNIKRVLDRLKDKENGFRAITPLEKKGWYGKSINDEIQLNLNMTTHENSPRLSKEDITRLYLYHEIGHKILNIYSNKDVIEKYLATVEGILQDMGVEKPDVVMPEQIPSGFLMIEECLTQELAEKLTYESIGKKRPDYKERHEIFSIQQDGVETGIVSTNHDFYGLFQEPTIAFGKTLRGCSHRTATNEEILSSMIHKALYTNFDEEVIREYYSGDGTKFQDLYRLLRTMGIILDQKYASFGNGKPIVGGKVSDCLKAVDTLARRHEDLRPYPSIGFKKIDYTKYLVQGVQKNTK